MKTISRHKTQISGLSFSIQVFLILLAFIGGSCKSKIVIGLLTLQPNHLVGELEPSVTRYLSSKNDAQEFFKSSSYLDNNYIRWLEQQGMAAYPLEITLSTRELLKELDNIDGLLLTGGNQKLFENQSLLKNFKGPAKYLRRIKALVSKIMDLNVQGHRFPIHAECLGFEALIMVQSDFTFIRQKLESMPARAVPLSYIDTSSRSGKFLDKKEIELLKSLPLSYMHHNWGFTVESFVAQEALMSDIRIVGTYKRTPTENIIAWIEFKNFPFYGLQFHPEKFHWQEKHIKKGGIRALREIMAVRFGQFFKSQAVDRNRKEGVNYTPRFPVMEIFGHPTQFGRVSKITDMLFYLHKHNMSLQLASTDK